MEQSHYFLWLHALDIQRVLKMRHQQPCIHLLPFVSFFELFYQDVSEAVEVKILHFRRLSVFGVQYVLKFDSIESVSNLMAFLGQSFGVISELPVNEAYNLFCLSFCEKPGIVGCLVHLASFQDLS